MAKPALYFVHFCPFLILISITISKTQKMKKTIFNMAKPALYFVHFCPFLILISITISTTQIEKSIDGVLGIRARAFLYTFHLFVYLGR